MLKGWTSSRKVATLVLLVASMGVVLAVVSNDGSTAADGSGTTSVDGGSGSGGTAGGDDGAAGATTDDGTAGGTSSPSSTTPKPLPLAAEVTQTTGLKAGDEVVVAVRADDGSQIFGVEMRQCREGTVVNNDADMRPSVAGQCALGPLSPGADSYKIVPSEGDRTEVRATYKVGTGTSTFALGDGGTSTVTCDSSHPCVLAVKYQIPGGFGFRTYPLTFS